MTYRDRTPPRPQKKPERANSTSERLIKVADELDKRPAEVVLEDDEPTLVTSPKPRQRSHPRLDAPLSDFPDSDAQTIPGRVVKETMSPLSRFLANVKTPSQAVVALAIVGGLVYLARLWLLK